MKAYKVTNIFLLAIAILFIACDGTISSDSAASQNKNIVNLESNLERNAAPLSSENELSVLAESNNKFAFSIFDKLYKNENANIFFSPYSISEALAIVYAGAKGDTKTEIASVFNFDSTDDVKLHENFNALDLHLNSDDENYILNLSNAIWIQKNYPVLDSYLDTIKVNYGANIKALDFINKTEESRITINEWVEEQTNKRIKDILSKGSINQSTPIVITNTVYFKGEWSQAFQKSYTNNSIFTAEDGSTKQIPFMNKYDGHYKYLKESYYQAIELPYKGGKSSMLIILPNENEFTNTVDNIENIYNNMASMSDTNLILKMPKFEFSTPKYDIKQYLETLGMLTPFSEGADFTNMSSDKSLFIDSIAHKAFIKVDENGTEATAATVVVDGNISAVDITTTFNVNRPFMIFIKDNVSKQILFMGLIKEPN